MSKMMQAMQDPEYKNKVEAAMKGLKDDPDMGDIFEELEKSGPAAMMKCVVGLGGSVRVCVGGEGCAVLVADSSSAAAG